jgi:hypothetical protein
MVSDGWQGQKSKREKKEGERERENEHTDIPTGSKPWSKAIATVSVARTR